MSNLIRPRLLDHYDLSARQEELSFAVPFLHEDIPLYIDPFLMWKSPSHQDQSLHASIIDAFNHIGSLRQKDSSQAIESLIVASECDEVGLGSSSTRQGKRIGKPQAQSILELFDKLPHFSQRGCNHIEEVQFYTDGIGKDRISDLSCSFIKSFLIDYTIDESEKIGIPLTKIEVPNIYSMRDRSFLFNQEAFLPINPQNGRPLILVPKRWLRYVPWINYEDYFKSYCPQDEIFHAAEPLERVKVLTYNRDNYGVIDNYIAAKEREAADCQNDPLFLQIPILSAKRELTRIKKLPTGNADGVDKEYEHIIERLLPTLLYPHLDFAEAQSRTESGVSIRDLIFYNNREQAFLKEIYDDYSSRQITFELKNVKDVEREHIDQLSRYLSPGLGHFGVIVTRNELSKARLRQVIDLWSAHRKAIIVLSDEDISMMVQVYESKQRLPLEVLIKKYVEFRRECPT